MKNRSIFCALILLLCACAHAMATDLSTRIDQYLSAHESSFSGVVLIAREGKPIFEKGYGMANYELNVPNTVSTRFRLGSVTKPFTAMAVMLLVEQGKLKLDDPLCKYIERCPTAWQPITIHHLLSHTSGIRNFTSMPEYMAMMQTAQSYLDGVNLVKSLPLEFQPGERFSYSNTGYVLLGMVIERASGTTYQEYLQKAIFDPLGMKATGYDGTQIIEHRASGYSSEGGRLTNARYINMKLPFSAGALYSTVGDLMLWDQALTQGKLLSASSLEKMMTPVLENYGYGWLIGERKGMRAYSHSGAINGFSSIIYRVPAEKLLIVILSNKDGQNMSRIVHNLLAMIDGAEPPKLRREIQLDPKVFDRYIGEYQLAPNFIIKVYREGSRFMTQATGQPPIEIFAESENVFFPKVVSATLKFIENEKGEVVEMVLIQGREMRAPKIK